MHFNRRHIFAVIILFLAPNVTSQNVSTTNSTGGIVVTTLQTNTNPTTASTSVISLVSENTTATTTATTTANITDTTGTPGSDTSTEALTTLSGVVGAGAGENSSTSDTSTTTLEGEGNSTITVDVSFSNVTVSDNTTSDTTESQEGDGHNTTTEAGGYSFLAGKVELQTQVYIISGTFGIVSFLMILLLLSLALSVAKIKDQIMDTESRYVVDREDRVTGYQNGGFSSGHMSQRYQEERSVDGDLKNMGYSIYSGNNRGNSETIPMQNVR